MLTFSVSSEDFTAAAMIVITSLTSDDLTFFFFFCESFPSEGNNLSALRLKISGPADFFPSLKWQLQTFENLLGSLSALLIKKLEFILI